MTDRPHYHFLLGGTKSSNLHTVIGRVSSDWHCSCGGHAEVRLYTPGVDLTAYVDKCLGGNLYEVKKYNQAGELELSRSVLKALEMLREDAVVCLGSPVMNGASREWYNSVDPKSPVKDGAGQTCLCGELQCGNVEECGGKNVSSPLSWRETSGGVYRPLS